MRLHRYSAIVINDVSCGQFTALCSVEPSVNTTVFVDDDDDNESRFDVIAPPRRLLLLSSICSAIQAGAERSKSSSELQ